MWICGVQSRRFNQNKARKKELLISQQNDIR